MSGTNCFHLMLVEHEVCLDGVTLNPKTCKTLKLGGILHWHMFVHFTLDMLVHVFLHSHC